MLGKCAGGCHGVCLGGCVVLPKRDMTVEEFKNWIKQGNGYGQGFQPSTQWIGPKTLEDVELPEGAPPEYQYDFKDLWMRYSLQLLYTNGMDLDTFPGIAEEANTGPWDINIPDGCNEYTLKEYRLIDELAELAIKEYNEESDFFKYKLLKIEKVNTRLTGYLEYFMTVKVQNLTLGTVYETLQIHAGRHNGTHYKEVFSCLPKGGALPSTSVMEVEVSLTGIAKRKRNEGGSVTELERELMAPEL